MTSDCPPLSGSAQREAYLELAIKLRDMVSPAHSPHGQQAVLQLAAQYEALSAHWADRDPNLSRTRRAGASLWGTSGLERPA